MTDDDDDFERHIDRLVERVREARVHIDAERRAGRQPSKSFAVMCERLERALDDYRRAGGDPQ